jgi:hypothetical protein
VGCAIVEQPLRDITDAERTVNHYDDEYKKILKFVPNSIWAWAESQFIDRTRASEIVEKEVGTRGFTTIETLDQQLALFAEIKAPVPIRQINPPE